MKRNADIGFITNPSTVTNQDHEANIGCCRRLAEFGQVANEPILNKSSVAEKAGYVVLI